MDKEHKTKRISLMDKLKQKTLPDDEPVITKGKMRKVRNKLLDEQYELKDDFGDYREDL